MTDTKEPLVAVLANQLYHALTFKQPLDMSELEGKVNDYETAYQVQDAFVSLRQETVQGYKVSLPSEETQRMFDSDELSTVKKRLVSLFKDLQHWLYRTY